MTDILFANEFNPPLAKKRIRFLAAVIDHFIVTAITLYIAYNYGERYTPEEGGMGVRLNGSQTLLCMGIWFLTIPMVESIRGQSIGKMMMNIKVISADYSNASFVQIIGRRLLDIVDWFPFFGIVGFIVASNTKNQQRVGDLVAKTIVVNK